MAFQPVPATALAELIFSLDSQIVENTLYFRRGTDYDVAALNALGDAVINWWDVNMQPAISTSCSLVRCDVTALHAQTGPKVSRTTGLPLAGLNVVTAVPNNVALCVSFRTALIGRAFRGRNYVAGIPESFFNVSRMSSGDAEIYRFAYQQLMTPLLGTNTWVVVTRTVNKVVQSPTALTNPVTAVVMSDFVADSQRRRLPGRGAS